MNRVPEAKFPLLVKKIVAHQLAQATHAKARGAAVFTEDEEAKLCEALGGALDAPALRTVVQCCAYVLGVAGHRGTPGAALAEELRARCGLDAPLAEAFGAVWAKKRAALGAALARRSLGGPKVLRAVGWDVQVAMAQRDAAHQTDTRATFELTLADADAAPAEATGGGALVGGAAPPAKGEEKVLLEFSHEELYALFGQIERVQEQLDTLADATS